MGSRLVNLEDLSSKIASSKPAVFSLFVLFLLALFRLYSVIFLETGLIRLTRIAYHFEILSSQVDTTIKS